MVVVTGIYMCDKMAQNYNTHWNMSTYYNCTTASLVRHNHWGKLGEENTGPLQVIFATSC